MSNSVKTHPPCLLGIEAGGTHTTALAMTPEGRQLARLELGPANLRLIRDPALLRLFRAIRREVPHPSAIGIGMAGARTKADWQRIRQLAGKVWIGVPVHATHDLETALTAGLGAGLQSCEAAVLVLSGTGSCCYGRNTDGLTRKLGGWGHLLGDKGSGYEIGLRALKAIVYYLDLDGRWTLLGQNLLRVLRLNEPNQLIDWVAQAGKAEVAALAPEVFQAAANKDEIACDILEGAASALAKDAVNCAKGLATKGSHVRFLFSGSVLLKQPRFAREVGTRIQERWPEAACEPLQRESVLGAVELARRLLGEGSPAPATDAPEPADQPVRDEGFPWSLAQLTKSPTEQRNPRSMKLDRMPLRKAVELMLSEDADLPAAILKERAAIEWTIRKITQAFQSGGRLFYTGAGTSGRLGILDASECPPTFRTDPTLVQGIIAGGGKAIVDAVEGAEDDVAAGAAAIRFRGVRESDVVVGITASGRTPFVWGSLWEAKKRGTTTVLLCFNPHLQVARNQRPDRIIAPDLGPEILTGSTRLKSGTATKLILNMFTTLAMVQIGKVHGNLMVDLNPSNVKLRDRAVRIVRELTGADEATALAALAARHWGVKQACLSLEKKRRKA